MACCEQVDTLFEALFLHGQIRLTIGGPIVRNARLERYPREAE
jgi:hypothetical protein